MTAPKTVNLASKLAEIMGLMGHIKKEGFNKNQRYAFVRESDVAERASQLLAERHIFLRQTVIESETLPLYETASGSQMWLTKVIMEFQFLDGDSGEVLDPVRFHGAGADTGDKGIYKAMTGAEKYFLMKTFLISTGDDPEADESVDKAAAGAAAKQGVRVSGKASTTAKKGGKSDGITDPQLKAITRLVKEKQFNKVAFSIALMEALDIKIEEDASLKDVVAGLTSEQAGKVIQFLDEQPDPEEEAVIGALTDEQEPMTVV